MLGKEHSLYANKRRQPGISAAVLGQIRVGRGDELTNAGGNGEGVGKRARRHADERLLPRIPGHFSRLVAFSCRSLFLQELVAIFAVVNFVSVVQLLHAPNRLLDH